MINNKKILFTVMFTTAVVTSIQPALSFDIPAAAEEEFAQPGVEMVLSEHDSAPDYEANSKRSSQKASSQEMAFSEPVSDEDLASMVGTFNPEQLGVALFDAQTVNNSVNSTATGFNNISSDAFGNSRGVVSLIQNTGNNVIIQNATIVNLTMSK